MPEIGRGRFDNSRSRLGVKCDNGRVIDLSD